MSGALTTRMAARQLACRRQQAAASVPSLTGLSAGTAYHFRAKAVGNGTAYGSDMTFTTTSGVPAAPTLSSPANGANVPGTSVTFQWNASPGATKYFLIVSTSPSLSTTSLVNGAEEAEPLLFPAAPTLSSPANRANVPGTSVTFQWNASPGATKYQFLIVRPSPSLSTTLSNSSVRKYYGQVNITEYTVTRFPNNGTTYYWWIYRRELHQVVKLQAQVVASGGWSLHQRILADQPRRAGSSGVSIAAHPSCS